MNKLPPSGIDFVFKISGNFSFLDGLKSLRYFTFRVAKFLAYIGCSNHFFYTNRHRIIHIIYHTITCHLKTLETLDRWCFKQTFLTFYPKFCTKIEGPTASCLKYIYMFKLLNICWKFGENYDWNSFWQNRRADTCNFHKILFLANAHIGQVRREKSCEYFFVPDFSYS